jgi:integrase
MFGRARRLKTIGHHPDTTLRDARIAAHAILAFPPRKQSISDKDALSAFLNDCAIRLRPTTVDRYRCALIPHREEIDLDTNDPNELKALKAFYNWCIDRGIRETNPVARRKVVFNTRDKLLSDEEITKILAYERKPYSTIVKLLIYTGQRRGQFAQFDQSWVQDDVIVFPASIMKSSRTHVLPATETVRTLILKLGTYGGWSKSKRRMDEHTQVSGYVLHDFRRYFSTTMAKLGVPLHITEHIIDHRTQIRGVAEIYNRYIYLAEMREALETYEAHIAKINAA